MTDIKGRLVWKGGPGSGHHGHSGRPGKRGGSLPGGSMFEGQSPTPAKIGKVLEAYIPGIKKAATGTVRRRRNAPSRFTASSGYEIKADSFGGKKFYTINYHPAGKNDTVEDGISNILQALQTDGSFTARKGFGNTVEVDR